MRNRQVGDAVGYDRQPNLRSIVSFACSASPGKIHRRQKLPVRHCAKPSRDPLTPMKLSTRLVVGAQLLVAERPVCSYPSRVAALNSLSL